MNCDNYYVAWLSIVSFAFICYVPSLLGGFVFDDTEAILNNPDVKLETSVYSIFKNDFWGTKLTSNTSHKSYRPFTVLTFRLNTLLTGPPPQPLGFHVVNIFLHALVSALTLPLYLQISKGNMYASVVSSLLFACHAIHSEAVAGIVGRADILAALMSVLALLNHLRSTSYLGLVLTVSLATAALFCKETGLAVLGACAGLDLLAHRHNRLLILVVASLALVLLRLYLMDFRPPVFHPMDNPAAAAPDVITRLVNYAYLWVLHCWLLLCPAWLCFDWSMGCIPLIDPSGGDVRLVLVVIAAVSAALAFRPLLAQPAACAAAIIGATAFSPASNLFVRVGFVVAERVLYLPSIGFCFLVGLGFSKVRNQGWHRVCLISLMILFAVNAAKCWERSMAWGSEQVLFSSALKVCPQNAKVHYNVAKTASSVNESIAYYRTALKLYPDYEQSMNNLANALRDLGHLEEAEVLLRRAVSIRFDFPAAWMNLGIVLANKGSLDEAEMAYKTALHLRPKYPNCLYNLGNLALARGKQSEALAMWQQVVKLMPDHAAAWNNLLVLLEGRGDAVAAEEEARRALKYLPNDAAVYFHLGGALGRSGKLEEAEPYLLRAVELKPDRALYRANLGVLYHRWRRLELAHHHYTAALSLDAKCPTAPSKSRVQVIWDTLCLVKDSSDNCSGS